MFVVGGESLIDLVSEPVGEDGIIRIGGMYTPEIDLKAVERLAREAKERCGGYCAAVEIGSWVGESALAIWRGIGPTSWLHCVDHWQGSPGDPTEIHLSSVGVNAVEHAFRHNTRSIVGGLSVHNTTSKVAAEKLRGNGDRWIDFLYIDADHRYESVVADIEAWLPQVREGGTICFHDYGVPQFPGVAKAVNELFGHYVQLFAIDQQFTTVAYIILTPEAKAAYDARTKERRMQTEVADV